MSLQEVNEVAAVISDICADDANIIFGTVQSYALPKNGTRRPTHNRHGGQIPVLPFSPSRARAAVCVCGQSVDESFDDEISVTVVATSFDTPDNSRSRDPMRQQPIQVSPAPPEAYTQAPDPYAPPASATRKPRFWSRF
jgi:cell division GTPase FtsZ